MKGKRLVAGHLLVYFLNFPELPVREDVVLESLRYARASELKSRAVLTYYDEQNFRARHAVSEEDFAVKKIGNAPKNYPFARVARTVEELDPEVRAIVTPSLSEIRLAEIGDDTEKLQRTLYRLSEIADLFSLGILIPYVSGTYDQQFERTLAATFDTAFLLESVP